MNFIFDVFVVMVFLFLGEWVAKATKAVIPSVFVSAILFLIGFWTFLPKNAVMNASFGKAFAAICIPLLLVHLGSIMSLKKLLEQWKAVCIALVGVCGTILLTLTVGTWFFNWHAVLAAVPPLTGGLISALLMTQGLKGIGATALVALPVSMFVIHSIFGYPLTSVLLKNEGHRQLRHFRRSSKVEQQVELKKSFATDKKRTSLGTKFQVPVDYHTSSYLIAKDALVCLVAYALVMGVAALFKLPAAKTGSIATIACLVLGVVAHQCGFIEDNVMNKAGVFNWLMYGLLAYCFAQLSNTTPKALVGIIGMIVVLIVLGIVGMFCTSWLLSKFVFKSMSWQMAFACALTALFGFPADYILTNEVVRQLSATKVEKKFLESKLLPPMLVGGFATVSVASVVIASVFLQLL